MKNILVLDGEDQLARYEDAEWVKRITESNLDYDPLQNRDESGKWTGGGDSDRGRGEGKSGVGEGYTSIKQEAEWVYAKIIDNPLVTDSPQNLREVKQWSEAVAKDGLGADTSVELQKKSDELINVVTDYTGSGSILMNRKSREEAERDPNTPDFRTGDKADALDKAIKVFPNNEEPTLYRGMTEDQARHEVNKTQSRTKELCSTLEVGSEFVDKGFISTSKDVDVATKFLKFDDLFDNISTIYNKAGKNADYEDHNDGIATYSKAGNSGFLDYDTIKKGFNIGLKNETNFFGSPLFRSMAKNGVGILLHPVSGDTTSRLRLTISKTRGKGLAVPAFMSAGQQSVAEREVILPRKARFRVVSLERVELYQSNLTGTKKPEVVGNLVDAKVELL